MTLENYSRIKLLTDRFSLEGLKVGDIGYIIEIYNDNAYEIEFSDSQGISIGQVVVYRNEFEVCESVN